MTDDEPYMKHKDGKSRLWMKYADGTHEAMVPASMLAAERARSQLLRKEMEEMRLKLSRLMIEAADAIGRWEAP